MKTRVIVFVALGVLIASGLIAGLFMGEIQKMLTLNSTMGKAIANVNAQNTGNQNPNGQATMQTMPNMQATATPGATGAMPAQTQGTTLASDNFQRKDQPLWGLASDGNQWNGDANTKPAFSIAGGTGQIANGNGTFNAVLGQASMNSEVLAGGMLNRFAGGANLGVVLRWSNADNWYKVLIDGSNLTLLKRVNGINTAISNVPFKAQGGTAYMLRFRAVGAMLFARTWQSGTTEPTTWTITGNDTTLLQPGQAGIRVLVQPGIIASITTFTAITAITDNNVTM